MTTPLSFASVLEEEYRARHDGVSIVGGEASDTDIVSRLRRAAIDEHVTALCLSGGGIRSASVSIGVLQGLARLGLLERFDYLSTVSGGGYAGGWLSAWRRREGTGGEHAVYDNLAGRLPPDQAEPAPLSEVRRLSRYLDPAVGIFSADVWTLIVTIIRNLLLNWLVLLPLLAAALLVPRLYLGVLVLASQRQLVGPAEIERIGSAAWGFGIVFLVAAMSYIALDLPSLGDRRWPQRRFLLLFLLPVCLTEVALSVSVAWRWIETCDIHSPVSTVLISTTALAAPGLAGVFVRGRGWSVWTWLGALVSGLLGGIAIWALKASYLMPAGTVVMTGTPGCEHALAGSGHVLSLYAAIDLPIALAVLVLELTLLTGMAGRSMTNDDREWWARAMAWLLIVAVGWLLTAGLVLSAHGVLDAALQAAAGFSLTSGAGHALVAAFTLVSGALASRAARAAAREPATPVVWSRIAFALAAPLFVVLLLIFIAGLDVRLLAFVERLHIARGEGPHPPGAGLVETLTLFLVLCGIGLVVGRRISVNLFSLHGMYRSRIVRTFLGASRPPFTRAPNRFTGFDPDDDLPLASLEPLGAPLHVVNCTLNLVKSTGRGGQERRGAAFTMSPLHAGSREVGYRPTDAYAGALSLGDALTISGAAVAPQSGDSSSPFLMFLLTLFNARLGVWLGNPGVAGDATWRQRDPGLGPGRLLSEMFGRTSAANPYVFLSDGGHFENLGIYEMVARGCRTIVVVDAGCDRSYVFADLGNAIRRVRVDLGIPIEFPEGLRMTAAGQGQSNAHGALGVIGYSALDPALPDGRLVYLKATLSGDEPVDVLDYARAHPAFPHEPTSNQWFSEWQFESYRMLGLHTIATVAGGVEHLDDVEGLARQVERYVAESCDTSARAATRSPVSNPSVNLA
jgi:hypothetical protein